MERKKSLQEIYELIEAFRRQLAEFGRKNRCFKELTPLQWQIINLVDSRKNCTPSTVAAYLGISRSAVSQQLDQLLKKGLLKFEPDAVDRRLKHLSLTEKAKKLKEKLKKDFLSLLESQFSALSDEELNKLKDILSKIIRS